MTSASVPSLISKSSSLPTWACEVRSRPSGEMRRVRVRPAVDVGEREHPREVEARGADGKHAAPGEAAVREGELAHEGGALAASPRAGAVGAVRLDGRERVAPLVVVRVLRGEGEQDAPGAEGAERPGGEEARAVEPEVHVRGAGDGEVPLARIVGAVADAHRVNHLGHDEPEIGVAGGVDVRHLVHRHAADEERHVLAAGPLEAADGEARRLPEQPAVAHVDAGERAEDVGAGLVGHRLDGVGVDLPVGGAARRRLGADGDLLGLLLGRGLGGPHAAGTLPAREHLALGSVGRDLADGGDLGLELLREDERSRQHARLDGRALRLLDRVLRWRAEGETLLPE